MESRTIATAHRAAPLLTLSILLMLGVSACGRPASARVVVPVSFQEAGSAAPQYPADFTSHEAVVRGVAAILGRELALRVPERVTVYIYSSRAVFEQGLVDDGRLPVLRAAELSEFAAGVGKRRQLLLHDEGGPPATREWLRLVAHELTHVAQIELAQGEGYAEQWLAEGMAEWAAFTVLERLGLDYVADRRAAAIGHVRAHPVVRGDPLDLHSLGSSRGFTLRHIKDGALPTYQLAFLMTDYLIRRHGFDALVGYFRGFAAGRGRFEGFRLAFGQSLEEFEAEIAGHLGQVLR
jgi:hypothetical protein